MYIERVFPQMNNKWNDQRNQTGFEPIKSELMAEISYKYNCKEFLKFAQYKNTWFCSISGQT